MLKKIKRKRTYSFKLCIKMTFVPFWKVAGRTYDKFELSSVDDRDSQTNIIIY